MNKSELEKYIEKSTTSLADTMRRINLMSKRILFLIDEDEKIVGTLTDGDIRRYILQGGRIDDRCGQAANKTPIVARSIIEATRLLQAKYQAIPVVDDNNRIVDIYEGNDIEIPKSRLNIPVVINAGGRGTRLDPFTRVLPKPLIPVGEVPIIELIMKEYQKYDCNEFHIIVNYKRELMKAYFAENENHYDIKWYDEDKDKPLGTGGGLGLLKGKFNGTFFFANCDALLTANYERMLEFHRNSGNTITMICAYMNLTIPYGIVEMGINGKIEEMKEKPQFSFLTNTGIYIVEPEVVEEIETDAPIGFPDVVENQRKKGKKVAAFPVNEDDWMDMGQLSELEKMRKKLYGE